MTVTHGAASELAVAATGTGSGPGQPRQSRLPVSVVALTAALGVLAVAAADTVGRLGHAASPWAAQAYWLGQALILVPAAVRLLGRRLLTARGTVGVIVVLTIAEYLVKVCYSPAAFTFADELEHWRSTVDVLSTGRLFTPNYLLPISPSYPGLEEVTSSLAAMTGLNVFTTGLIVAGAAHLLFVCLLYVIFRHVSGSHRLAGLAVLLYAGNSHFQSFDSMFAYQTLAVVFLALTLLAVWHLTTAPDGEARRWTVIAVAGLTATVITHHVTSYVLVAVLVVITMAALATGHRRAAARVAGLALVAAVAVVGWLLLAAPETVTYLQPIAGGLFQGLRNLLTGAHSAGPSVSGGPLGNRVLAAAALLAVSALLPFGWWLVWRQHRRDPWLVAMALGSLGWYGLIAVRLTVADGSELAGRASTFMFIPAACIAALAVGQLATAGLRGQASAVTAGALIGALALLFDGLANGWPPTWERLPGPFQVGGFERSVDPQGIAAARWALRKLGTGNRFATDFGDYPVLGSYGYQNPVRDVAYLYLSGGFRAADASRVRAESIRYVLVDQRLSQSLPVSGQYFPDDGGPITYTRPIPLANLRKFSRISGVSRVYDGGDIVVYDLRGSAYER